MCYHVNGNRVPNTTASRNVALGNRSIDLDAAVKERQRSRGIAVSPETPEIEYEYGNGDPGPSDDERDTHSDNTPSGRRLIMVYDEDGNATPMPMGRFYYDSVQSDNRDEVKEADGTPAQVERAKLPVSSNPSCTSTIAPAFRRRGAEAVSSKASGHV